MPRIHYERDTSQDAYSFRGHNGSPDVSYPADDQHLRLNSLETDPNQYCRPNLVSLRHSAVCTSSKLFCEDGVVLIPPSSATLAATYVILDIKVLTYYLTVRSIRLWLCQFSCSSFRAANTRSL